MQSDILSDRDKAIYLAVWIDCEGSITLGIRRMKSTLSSWHPEIRIVNTKVEAIKLLSGMTGSSYIRRKRTPRYYSPCYDLILTANKCREWLPKVKPFLVIKKRQAILLTEALALLDMDKHLIGGSSEWRQKNRPKLEANQQRLREIYVDIKQLNKRGRTYGRQIHLMSSM